MITVKSFFSTRVKSLDYINRVRLQTMMEGMFTDHNDVTSICVMYDVTSSYVL